LLAECLTAVIVLANMPFFSVSAQNTPSLSIQEITVQAEDVSENRNVGVDLIISNNQDGFLASSFGIQYNENLTYTNAEVLTDTGAAFEIVCNPDAHLLWFAGGGSSGDATASALEDEAIIRLYFDISEAVDGGDFGLEFVWSGIDGSNAYWYTCTQDNVIDELSVVSQSSEISFCNPESEKLNYTDLQLNPDAQEQLQIINASGSIFWFSSNPEIADVNQDGIVTAVSSGECQIQAFVNNHLLSCNVTVLDLFHYSVANIEEEIVMTDINIPVVLEYPDATEDVTWISANPDVITVDNDGTLHALKEGTANILATCNGKTYMKVIKVNFSASSKPEESLKLGDVDGNDIVDILDIISMNKAILGQKKLTSSQMKCADINADGIVDTKDSLMLMKMIVGLV
ncbi:MAG: Ig-like domain-containing protein, partial [Oscillospiraceae bacterium]|nr:Ig-like domain-containing protein [Oscillospiraceae bacterium]